MSARRTWLVLRKDLALGPRSPIFMYAILLPVVLTLMFQLAFGSLFEPKPRMAIVDEGSSAITQALKRMEGIELALLDDAGALKTGVEANDYDGGLVLPAGFDQAVRDKKRPLLEFYIGGESLASNRIILSVTTLDLVREVEGTAPPVNVKVVNFGEAGLPISVRLVPLVMMYALFIAGAFMPASSLVDEKAAGTLLAMLVTPVKASEIVAAKGLFGALMAFLMSIVTLALNDALGSNWAETVVVVAFGAAFCAVLGLVFGTLAKDSASLFTILKGSGILLFAPVIFYVFPEWPQWISMLFPTHWMIDPIWKVAVLGQGLADVWGSLFVALGIVVALGPVIRMLSVRMLKHLA